MQQKVGGIIKIFYFCNSHNGKPKINLNKLNENESSLYW
jgi:hypothetical protein